MFTPTHYVFHPYALIGYLLTAIGAGGKYFVGDKLGKIEETHDLVKEMTGNHLPHIEENTKRAADGIEALRIEQAKTNGFLEALLAKK